MDRPDAAKRIAQAEIRYGRIRKIEKVPAGSPENFYGVVLTQLPEHYRVFVRLKPSPESCINAEIWLPSNGWNGRLLGLGNSGYGGRTNHTSLVHGLSRGFVTADSDLGTGPDPDALIGKKERWADFGHRATHLMTDAAKSLIRAFYGIRPRYSYFMGGSTGGQQGMMEAQRYPEDYDGIVVFAPAHNRTRLHAYFLWNYLALTASPSSRIGPREAGLIARRIGEEFGARSGSMPGEAFLTCPERILDETGSFRWEIPKDFLGREQGKALELIYSGAKNPRTGERLFEPFVPGGENLHLGLYEQGDRKNFPREFFYPFRWVFGKNFDPGKFDFDRDLETLDRQLGGLVNAVDPDLGKFRDAGGKMIMATGASDPVIPCTGALRYYREAVRACGGAEETGKFFRCFLIPGMGHIFGGPGFQEAGLLGIPAVPRDKEHDLLESVMAWREKGIGPEKMTAVSFREGEYPCRIDREREIFACPGEKEEF